VEAGEEVLLRYRYRDGSVQAAYPMRVVGDTGDRVVAWLATGTPILYWATATGGDPRDRPLARRFRGGFAHVERTWQGPGVLRVIPLDLPYQVIHFWGEDGTFTGWYVNFESAKDRRGRTLDAIEWHLDLWFDPQGRPQWKDQDEAGAAVAGGHLLPAELELSVDTGQSIVDDFDHWLVGIGDWRRYQPDPQWTLPELPPDAGR
jgi:Protein of unknown function (DUF402)